MFNILLVCVLGHVQLSVTPWTVARKAPLSMEFPPQEYWSGLPFPPLGALPTQGLKPHLLCLLNLPEYSLPLHHLDHPFWYIIIIFFTITNYILIKIPLFPCMSKQTKMINLILSYCFVWNYLTRFNYVIFHTNRECWKG